MAGCKLVSCKVTCSLEQLSWIFIKTYNFNNSLLMGHRFTHFHWKTEVGVAGWEDETLLLTTIPSFCHGVTPSWPLLFRSNRGWHHTEFMSTASQMTFVINQVLQLWFNSMQQNEILHQLTDSTTRVLQVFNFKSSLKVQTMSCACCTTTQEFTHQFFTSFLINSNSQCSPVVPFNIISQCDRTLHFWLDMKPVGIIQKTLESIKFLEFITHYTVFHAICHANKHRILRFQSAQHFLINSTGCQETQFITR